MRNKLVLLIAIALASACARNAKPVESVTPVSASARDEAASKDAPPAPLALEETPEGSGPEPASAGNTASEAGSTASGDEKPEASEPPRSAAEVSRVETPEVRPDPSKALPELVFRHVGMHIGGESNTPEAKKPFLDAIEKRKKNILLCYREVNAPKAGGTFGIDFRVPTEGGAPEVKKLRHKLGGFEFDSCMHKAFESIRFPALSRPTMVSYSLRFEFKEKKR